jgi:hypothetical protein
MREVVKKEVLKLLHTDIIYPMQDSEWVSPVQVVPKKGGMREMSSYLRGQLLDGGCVSIIGCSIRLPGKITFLSTSLMRCLNNWQSIHSSATLIDTLVIIKFLSIWIIRERLPSPVPMACLPTDECCLVFAMHLLHFKGV